MKTLRLSLAGAEWLVADSGLSISPSSPFASLAAAPPRASAAERVAAAGAELFAAGISFGAGLGEASPTGAPFRESLELLAQPEARIQVVTQTAGHPPIKMTLFARAGMACPFVSDREAFHIGAPRAVDGTFAALQEQVRAPRELEGQQILFWPSVLGLLVLLWPGAGQDLAERLLPEEALRRLGAPAVAKEKAEAVLRELEDKGLISREDRVLSVSSAYRRWLHAALSGHMLQLDFVPLDGVGSLEKADERAARLLFVGPPGARVLSRTLAGDELTQVLRGGTATEPRAIHLSALLPARLADLLRVHLGLSR